MNSNFSFVGKWEEAEGEGGECRGIFEDLVFEKRKLVTLYLNILFSFSFPSPGSLLSEAKGRNASKSDGGEATRLHSAPYYKTLCCNFYNKVLVKVII